MKNKGGSSMPDWVIYGLFPCYIAATIALIVYGIVLSLKRVPTYDVVAEACKVAQAEWTKAEVQE